MVQVDRKFLTVFSILLLGLAGVITINSNLYWTIDPPHPHVHYSHVDRLQTTTVVSLGRILPSYNYSFDYIKNGSIYSPYNVLFFNFSFNAYNIQPNPNFKQNSTLQVGIGFYFYLFKTVNSTHKQLVRFLNTTDMIDYNHTTLRKQFYWSSLSEPNYFISGVENSSYSFEFILTFSPHYYYGTRESDWGTDILAYAPQIQYHFNNNSQLVFDSYKERNYPPFATFTYFNWGVFNYAVLISGLFLISCSILVLVYRKDKSFTNL